MSWATHTYFFDFDSLGRHLGFYTNLLSSPSREVIIFARIVAKDIRSTKKLRLLEVETEGMIWSASNSRVKEKPLQSKPRVALEDQWRF